MNQCYLFTSPFHINGKELNFNKSKSNRKLYGHKWNMSDWEISKLITQEY